MVVKAKKAKQSESIITQSSLLMGKTCSQAQAVTLKASKFWPVTFGFQAPVIGFHLSPHRDSPQAVSLFSEVIKLGKPSAIVSDRYSAYKVPVKSIFDGAKHIRVQSLLPTVG